MGLDGMLYFMSQVACLFVPWPILGLWLFVGSWCLCLKFRASLHIASYLCTFPAIQVFAVWCAVCCLCFFNRLRLNFPSLPNIPFQVVAVLSGCLPGSSWSGTPQPSTPTYLPKRRSLSSFVNSEQILPSDVRQSLPSGIHWEKPWGRRKSGTWQSSLAPPSHINTSLGMCSGFVYVCLLVFAFLCWCYFVIARLFDLFDCVPYDEKVGQYSQIIRYLQATLRQTGATTLWTNNCPRTSQMCSGLTFGFSALLHLSVEYRPS